MNKKTEIFFLIKFEETVFIYDLLEIIIVKKIKLKNITSQFNIKNN